MQPFFSSQLAAAFSCILQGDQIERSLIEISLNLCQILISSEKQIVEIILSNLTNEESDF